ncbi:MAG: family 10 glycosylhydrolase, partial [Bacteroidota bacterium]
MKNTLTPLFSLLFLSFTPFLLAQTDSPKREFRAVWIATVKNLDWPSRSGLSTAEQQKEIRDILDFHQKNGMNAVIMQVRPSADAFYFSAKEPWSEWLSGQQGKAPFPWYDPLTYFVEESHKRGMEFHAWFNPFRALMDVDNNKLLSVEHISNKRPDWLVRYGKNLYFDPGIPKAREYVSSVILDVVNRYDIDAVHFDDYFYPYRIANEEFPDSSSYEAYGRGYPNRDNWRRNNVDSFVESINYQIKATKAHVKLGISPFGVWRNIADDPLGSDSRAGQTSYDDLYADIRAWLLKGWIDYVVPQIYFSIGYPPADYEKLADWWAQNQAGRHLYIGKATYKIDN